MDGIIMAAQMILALSIIVGIHEFGHLLAAKFFGMRVEKYLKCTVTQIKFKTQGGDPEAERGVRADGPRRAGAGAGVRMS